MIPEASPADPHLDHDLAQLLHLGLSFDTGEWARFPEYVRRAMVVAYATHLRVVLEFFHDGRPSQQQTTKSGHPRTQDVTFTSLTGTTRPDWTPDEVRRLSDADKLASHLSAARASLPEDSSAWGGERDRQLYAEHFLALFRDMPHAADRLAQSLLLGLAAGLLQTD